MTYQRHYVVILKSDNFTWMQPLGDYGHLLTRSRAEDLFNDIDYSDAPQISVLLCELVLAQDMNITLRTIKSKTGNEVT